MGVRALCLACVLAFAPRAFAQAPGTPSTSVPASPASDPPSPAHVPSAAADAAPPTARAPEPATVAPAVAPAAVFTEAAPPPAPAALTRITLAPPTSAPPTSAPPTSTPSERSGLSPTYFWIAASTTIIVASLGGFEALHVRDLYDQANGLPTVSPEREPLHDEMKTAELTADALLIGSLALAVGTTILAFHIDWSGGDRANEELARRTPPSTAGRRWW
jgi:hypothetical protein